MIKRTNFLGGGLGLLILTATILAACDSESPGAPGEEPIAQPAPIEEPSKESPTAAPPSPPRPVAPPLPRSLPPEPSPNRLHVVDQILEQMARGRVAFNAPDAINANETAVIHLVLGVSQEMEELTERIEAEGARVGAEIRVSSQMEARLTGPHFAITAITPEVQAVSATETTEWKWEVKPTAVGSHSLHLTLSAIVNLEGSSVRRAIRTFDHVMEVEVTWPQRVTGFFGENWQWLWAAILVPLATGYWRRRKRSGSAD